jgi:hypothetical protein
LLAVVAFVAFVALVAFAAFVGDAHGLQEALQVGGARAAGAQVCREARLPARGGRGVVGRQLGVDVQQRHRLFAAHVPRVRAQEVIERGPAVHGCLTALPSR